MDVRPAAVAGSFYSNQANELQCEIKSFLEKAAEFSSCPKAIIAPHAGYIYSGSIAASAYNTIKENAHLIQRVVVLGPAHRLGFSGVASPGCQHFQTPLGLIAVDQAAISQLHDLALVYDLPQAHALEHSLEVQLPFLQLILNEFSIVPLVVGEAGVGEVAEILEQLWGGEETLVVVSSDLSHFHPYSEAQKLDQQTTAAIELFDEHLNGDQACGCRPINGLLHVAKRRGLKVTTLDVRNSGDTAGDKEQVVGYGAYAVH